MENKHHTLSRCVQTGFSDAELKPNALTRDQINAIVNYPPTKSLSSEEQDLIWKFRYYLRSNKKVHRIQFNFVLNVFSVVPGIGEILEMCKMGHHRRRETSAGTFGKVGSNGRSRRLGIIGSTIHTFSSTEVRRGSTETSTR